MYGRHFQALHIVRTDYAIMPNYRGEKGKKGAGISWQRAEKRQGLYQYLITEI